MPADPRLTTARSLRPGHRPGRPDERDDAHRRGRAGVWLRHVLYWLAVTAVSLAVVALLLGLIHSYDDVTVGIVAIGRG